MSHRPTLLSLAKVELQLVAHGLDKTDLLRFARCCRATLAAVADDFAWRYLSPVSIPSALPPPSTSASTSPSSSQSSASTPAPAAPSLPAAVSSSLLRHADLTVRWSAGSGRWKKPALFDAELQAMCAVPRLRGLDARARRGLEPESWRQLLSQPATRGLTALSLTLSTLFGRLPPSFVSELAAAMPQLRMLCIDGLPRAVERHAWSQLPLLTHLTDLHLVLGHGPALHSGVDSIRDCRALRRLALSVIYDDVWSTILTAPNLSATLESLTLGWVRADIVALPPSGAAQVDWAACFAALRALKHLEIKHCREEAGLTAMMQALVEARPDALRRVDVVIAAPKKAQQQPQEAQESASASKAVQEHALNSSSVLADAVQRMLVALPQVELQMTVPSPRVWATLPLALPLQRALELHTVGGQSRCAVRHAEEDEAPEEEEASAVARAVGASGSRTPWRVSPPLEE